MFVAAAPCEEEGVAVVPLAANVPIGWPSEEVVTAALTAAEAEAVRLPVTVARVEVDGYADAALQ